MNEDFFVIGDVAKLRSGGPEMTIIKTCDNNMDVLCAWFDNDGKNHKSEFPEAALILLQKKTEEKDEVGEVDGLTNPLG